MSTARACNIFFESGVGMSVFFCCTVYKRFIILVTVAEVERSFSKPSLIKNYKRSTMGQERLSHLSLLSIEQCWARSSIFGSALAFLRSSGRG